MPSIPQIQIRQQYAKIGIDADLGQYEIRQPKPKLEIEQPKAEMEIRQPQGTLEIDQTKAWDALGLLNNLEVMHRVRSQARSIAMEGIAKIVEKGNELAAIHKGGNPIAEQASRVTVSFPEFNYVGEASFLNVKLNYTANWPVIEANPQRPIIRSEAYRPEVEYHRGKLDIYMRQWNSLEIIPPQIDIRW